MDNSKKTINDIVSDLWNYEAKGEKPVIVVGPAEDNVKKTLDDEGCKNALLRIYSYGGKLGGIKLNETENTANLIGSDYLENHLLKKDDLTKYSESELNQVDAWKKQIDKILLQREQKSKKKSKTKVILSGKRDEIFYGDSLKLAVRSTWLWGQKDSEAESKERNEQTRVIKHHIGPLAEYVGKYVPTDMEYKLPIPQTGLIKNSLHIAKIRKNNDIDNGDYTKNRKKPDFIVFDGKSFGLVEMKYNGASMEMSQANSLREHFLDFVSIIAPPQSLLRKEDLVGANNENIWYKYANKTKEEQEAAIYKVQWEVLHECLYRALCISKVGLLSEDCIKKLNELVKWYNEQDTSKPFPYEKGLLWCGFYFMNGPKVEGKTQAGAESKIIGEVKKQLSDLIAVNISKENPSPITIKYQFCEYDKINFDFSTDIIDIVNGD